MQDAWTIAITIGTNDYDAIIGQMDDLFLYLENQQYIVEHADLIPSFELKRLKANLEVMQKQVDNFKLLLPSHKERHKHGLIDGIGSALKFLFGTINNDDIEHLNSKLTKFEPSGESLLHVEADRLTYMRKLNDEVGKHSEIIQSIIQTIKQMKLTIPHLQ